ncbi:unnamed protein product [Rotaria sp. Silwood2]|nr:unnamed protein product [Rotaria sp. Silwood2]CAF2699220.1 unnamed protein product [Rotaria sp. Silwood2]CAF2960799.1 unnamed protein product [Rotaria sp. Silwood2]CAF3121982.1 unnamed protein product [Rotaria sp. Silwood2]CAF3965944.1 unnamed protein product [Rotaria sp. Silwood2]
MNSSDHHQQHKSAIKEDITDIVKERTHSISSSRHSSMSSDNSASFNNVTFNLQDDIPSATIKTRQTSKGYVADTESLDSFALSTSVGSSSGMPYLETHRYSIDQLALNMGFGGIKPSVINPSNSSTTSISSSASLVNSSVSSVQPVIASSNLKQEFKSNDDIFLNQEISNEKNDSVEERVIMKVDPVEMTAKLTVVTVPKDRTRRAAILLSGPKFRLNVKEIPLEKLPIRSDTIFTSAMIVGVMSLIFALWKPISPYFSGLIVGVLFAATLFHIWIRIFINKKINENAIEERIDFPALESLFAKYDKEDKDTNIKVTGASIAFQRYEADNDDDFVRYPCDIRLDGYRLIIQLASKPWNEDKKPDKEVKFIGYREYLIKEARMTVVPEATLTRAKYWMNDYPIVIQHLQILDKQIYNIQLLEKSKLDANDFFTNPATTLSIWFETGPQKEEWFHKLSLILRYGKEEIERTNSLIAEDNTSLSSSVSNSSSYRRLAQTDSDIELVSNSVKKIDIDAGLVETQMNIEELQEKANIVESDNDEMDASGTHRTRAKKSKKMTPNEACLRKVLQSPECLDETAITVNCMARRLLREMFDSPVFKDLIKTKIEMKLKEIAVSILENLRVVSIDLGNTFPLILKVEPMQWNTQGLWLNLFLYYRGSIKLSVKTRVLLQRLINYNPKKDKPIFAQYHTAQLVHKDDERIDEDDLIQRQKLLAKEPEIPEMAVTRKLGLALMNLALNKYFQMFANIPFVKKLFEKFSEEEVGANIEITSFSGVLTLNIPPPPSDRIWVGFSEVPVLNIKATPTYGEKDYSYTLLEDVLAAKIRAEIKRMVVLPAMDDQLLPFFRDWVIDIIGEIASEPINPLTDNYKAKLNAQAAVRAGLQEYSNGKEFKKQTSTTPTVSSAESTNL